VTRSLNHVVGILRPRACEVRLHIIGVSVSRDGRDHDGYGQRSATRGHAATTSLNSSGMNTAISEKVREITVSRSPAPRSAASAASRLAHVRDVLRSSRWNRRDEAVPIVSAIAKDCRADAQNHMMPNVAMRRAESTPVMMVARKLRKNIRTTTLQGRREHERELYVADCSRMVPVRSLTT